MKGKKKSTNIGYQKNVYCLHIDTFTYGCHARIFDGLAAGA